MYTHASVSLDFCKAAANAHHLPREEAEVGCGMWSELDGARSLVLVGIEGSVASMQKQELVKAFDD